METKPKMLDLFCGAGGAAMGYFRAGFSVVGVDIKPQVRYPFEFHQADALEFCARHGAEFDAIHASPPCQAYSWLTPAGSRQNHPDLIGKVRTALRACARPYVIENVEGARRFLIQPLKLCGSQFGLKLFRHRYFEIGGIDCPLILVPSCNHAFVPVLISGTTRRKGFSRRENTVAERRDAAEIPWMTKEELDDAIPPAFTEFIGKQLMEVLRGNKNEA